MTYPKSINNLISNLKNLPGVGEKTAERMALAMIDFDKEKLGSFSDSITDVKDKIRHCLICNNLSEEDECIICKDKTRDSGILCIVDDVRSLMLFEKNNLFNGKYHILKGLISPSNGIDPEDIDIEALINRVEKEKIKELIIAVKPSLEGEATALYIAKRLEPKNITVSKIAHGVPMGADMEYLDAITLRTALFERKKIS
ncbi:MAG TPA: recombination protein RecR [Mollicutes bacterium]|jgi:recombination protein RecR|nr:recombination protein RecR [Mollicutes bacterium]